MAGKHSETGAPRRRRIALSALGVLALMCAGVIVGFAGTGGTYAAWNSSATVKGATLTTGSTVIQVGKTSNGTFAASLDLSTLTSNMEPGDTVAAGFTMKNTGTTGVTVGANVTATPAGNASTSLAGALRVAVVALTGSATCSSSWGTPNASLTSYSASNLAQLATNTTRNFCLLLTLPTGAPSAAQGGSVPFTVNLTGLQVAS